MAATPLRNVRIDDALWHAVKERAAAEGRTVTDVIVACLTDYAAGKPKREPARKRSA